MKNLLPLISLLFLMAACKTDTQPERDIKLLADSTVFSNNNMFTDQMSRTAEEEVKATPPETKVVYITKYIPRDERNAPVSNSPKQPDAATPPIVQQDNGTVAPSTGNSDADAGVVKQEKKGWSKAAQGAVIGGAAGAVAGAIISKKKGLGAAIGAVVGAAGGYIIGKNKDKKEKAKNPFLME